MNRNKRPKGQLSFPDMPAIGLLFVVAGVTLGLGAMVITEMNDMIGSPSGGVGEDVNATLNVTVESIGQLSSWLPIIAVVLAAGVVIGSLILVFMFRNR